MNDTDLSIILWKALEEKGATFTPAEHAPIIWEHTKSGYPVVIDTFAKAKEYHGEHGNLVAPYFGEGGASNLLMALEILYEKDTRNPLPIVLLKDEALLRLLCAALKICRETGEKI